MNMVHPKKLLLSKWTAVQPLGKDKHFLVSALVLPEPVAVAAGLPPAPPATTPALEFVELEALMSKAVRRLRWRELKDSSRWRQGWL